jgi:hypothetical protein
MKVFMKYYNEDCESQCCQCNNGFNNNFYNSFQAGPGFGYQNNSQRNPGLQNNFQGYQNNFQGEDNQFQQQNYRKYRINRHPQRPIVGYPLPGGIRYNRGDSNKDFSLVSGIMPGMGARQGPRHEIMARMGGMEETVIRNGQGNGLEQYIQNNQNQMNRNNQMWR